MTKVDECIKAIREVHEVLELARKEGVRLSEEAVGALFKIIERACKGVVGTTQL